MASGPRDWFIVGTLIVLVWRFLPPAQALLASAICAGALWLTYHPVIAANFMNAVTHL